MNHYALGAATIGDVNGVTPHFPPDVVDSEPGKGEGGGGEGGKDMVDGVVRKKRGKKRPLSGYYLPDTLAECDLVTDLGHEDDR